MKRVEDERPILVLAHTGLIIRNLLLGKFADHIIAHKPMVVAVQDPDSVLLQEIIHNKPITLIPFRTYKKEIRSRRDILGAGQYYIYRLKEAEKQTKSLKLQTRLWEGDRSFLGKSWKRFLYGVGRIVTSSGAMGMVERLFLRSVKRWSVTEDWYRLLEELQPSVILSTMLTHAGLYAPSVDLPAVVAAHLLGVPTGTLVQSWDNLTSKTSILPPWLNRYWTWSEFMSRELLALHSRIPAEHVKVVGSPQFDYHADSGIEEDRSSFMVRVGLDPSRPYILIGTGTEKWMPDEPEKVMRLVESLKHELPDCQVLIRLHPKDHGTRWSNYRDRFAELKVALQITSPETHMDRGGFTPPKEFYKDQISALVHASAVINTASTLTVDAAILDRPVISIGYDVVPDQKFPEGRAWAYNQSSHYGSLVKTGGVSVVRSQEECVHETRRYLANPHHKREGRHRIVQVVAGRIDGKAGERLARDLLALSSSKCVRSPKAGQ